MMAFLTVVLAENITSVQEGIDWLEKMSPLMVDFGKKFLGALIFVLIGRKLIQWLKKILKKSFQRSSMDKGVEKFLLSFIGIGLNVVLLVAAISILGVETSSFAAIIGSAGLAIGLSLQGSLSNFAGGVLILVMKPFHVGDYIISNGMEGTVTGIDVFYTKLLTTDNRKVVIPNGGLANSSIVNVTNEEFRRLDISLRVAFDCDLKRVKEILSELIGQEPLVLIEHPVDVYIDSFQENGIALGIRVWTKKEDYFALKCRLMERIKESFDAEGIIIPHNQLNVTINSKGIN